MASLLKTAAIPRIGFEYQDLVGIQMLIEFYRTPSKFLWMQLESEDKTYGFLDDVVAARSDGSFDLVQVKFTADSDVYFLDWDWLLAKKRRGRCLLEKWCNTLRKFNTKKVRLACLRTNRRPDTEFTAALNSSNHIDFDRLSSARRKQLEGVFGSAFAARTFFRKFQFDHSLPFYADFENELMDSLVPSNCDANAWLQLRQRAREWATKKNSPEPDGRIVHTHLTQIITKKAPRPMTQSFAIPEGYAVPRQSFHDSFKARVRNGAHQITVLWGTPGRGKSTYLSYLVRELQHDGVPVVRHHYFLSLDDTTSDRFSYPNIADTLCHQMDAYYHEAVEALGQGGDNQLRHWLETCGRHFKAKGLPFVVIIDGLDHVYRERRTLEQLDHLFDILLPCPENVILVVGTQRVPDDQLPSKLIARATQSDWQEIPAMDEYSVQSWINQQYRAKRLRLSPERRPLDPIAQRIGGIGKAFFDISHGHPLHLIYSFEYLVRKGGYITADDVRLLPSCPDGDINQYYAKLWKKLSERAREIVHLIAGCDFRWPFGELVRVFGQIDEIDFLLEHRRTGLVPFHGSILAFVRAKTNHDAVFSSLLPRVVKWLRGKAPSYHKWGWLWLMEARLGKETPLLRGATREWAIESLAAGWPVDQMVNILKAAERVAFDKGDYADTIRLRTIKHRLENAEEFQGAEFPKFVAAAITSSANAMAIDLLADALTSLPEATIVSLARMTVETHPSICDECERELAYRVGLWLNLRHRPPNEFLALSKYYADAAALAPSLDVRRLLNFIRGFRDGTEVFEVFVDSLVRVKRSAELALAASQLRLSKHASWRRYALNRLAEVCTTEQRDPRLLLKGQETRQLPGFLACWLRYHKIPVRGAVHAPVRPTSGRSEYEMKPATEGYLVERFFYELFQASKIRKNAKPKYETVGASAEYVERAAVFLTNTARDIASGRSQLSFATIYYAARSMDAVHDRNHDSGDYHQYHAFRPALRKIAIWVHLLKQPMGTFNPVSIAELATARASSHWVEEVLIDEVLSRTLPLLSAAEAEVALKAAIEFLDKTVTPFNERADKWTELARFAMFYQRPEISSCITRAANCYIGYGWRKDLWLDEVLECVSEVHEAGAADGLPMLRQLVPLVEQITEFTDGDETGSVRETFIEAVARVSPDRLPDLYAHHISEDDFRYAEIVLAEHLKIADLASEVGGALARTLIEHSDLQRLEDLGARSPAAVRLFQEQMKTLGGMPPKVRHYPEGNTNTETNAKNRIPPDVSKFGPDQIQKLLKAMENDFDYEGERITLRDWLNYWEKQGRAVEALSSLKAYLEKEENVYRAEDLLDDAFAMSLRVEGKKRAYKFLVLAQIHLRGWSRYFTSTSRALERLDIAAKHYRRDWQKFIHDTSEQALYWRRRNYDFVIATRFLVRFLLLVGQNQLAAAFTRACIRVAIAETSDQPLPSCPWFR